MAARVEIFFPALSPCDLSNLARSHSSTPPVISRAAASSSRGRVLLRRTISAGGRLGHFRLGIGEPLKFSGVNRSRLPLAILPSADRDRIDCQYISELGLRLIQSFAQSSNLQWLHPVHFG